eukprot:GHVR01004343.1.p1 GENE.GHVR01004343.1~~GHVR01004343.1.p1  ORF type:complete len:140 (-),score=12.69 GHVR01004343.1:43-462(-)
MYAYIHIHAYTQYTHIHSYTSTHYMHIYMHIHVHINKYTCMHICKHIHIYAYTHIHICTYTYKHIDIRMHIYIHTYTYTLHSAHTHSTCIQGDPLNIFRGKHLLNWNIPSRPERMCFFFPILIDCGELNMNVIANINCY